VTEQKTKTSVERKFNESAQLSMSYDEAIHNESFHNKPEDPELRAGNGTVVNSSSTSNDRDKGRPSLSPLKTASQSESEVTLETLSDADSKLSSTRNSEPEVEQTSEPMPETISGPESEHDFETKSDMKSEIQMSAATIIKSEIQLLLDMPAVKSELKAELKSEIQNEASWHPAAAILKPEIESETRPEIRSETNSETEFDPTSEPMSGIKSKNNSETSSELMFEPEVDPTSEVKSKPNSKLDTEPMSTSTTGPKSEPTTTSESTPDGVNDGGDGVSVVGEEGDAPAPIPAPIPVKAPVSRPVPVPNLTLASVPVSNTNGSSLQNQNMKDLADNERAPAPTPTIDEDIGDVKDRSPLSKSNLTGAHATGPQYTASGKVADGSAAVDTDITTRTKTSNATMETSEDDSDNEILTVPDPADLAKADAHAKAMGTAGAGEDVISAELRATIVTEHGIASVDDSGFKMHPAACGKAGPVALITVWGSVPIHLRDSIVDALDNSGIEDGGTIEDRGVQSWRGVGRKSLRIVNIYKTVFGGRNTLITEDPLSRRMCIANFFVNSKMASTLGSTGSSGKDGGSGGNGNSKSKMVQAVGFREFFLKHVLPSDDRRGDHDALVLALAVNCQTSKRMQLLWKLYGALASKFGLTKNDIHLSVGTAQVSADVHSLLGVAVEDLVAIRDEGKGWTRGDEPVVVAKPVCPALMGEADMPGSPDGTEGDSTSGSGTKEEDLRASRWEGREESGRVDDSHSSHVSTIDARAGEAPVHADLSSKATKPAKGGKRWSPASVAVKGPTKGKHFAQKQAWSSGKGPKKGQESAKNAGIGSVAATYGKYSKSPVTLTSPSSGSGPNRKFGESHQG